MKKRLIFLFSIIVSFTFSQTNDCEYYNEIVQKDIKKKNIHLSVNQLIHIKGGDSVYITNNYVDAIIPSIGKLLLKYHGVKELDYVVFDTIRDKICYTKLMVHHLENERKINLDSVIKKAMELSYIYKGSNPPYIIDTEKFHREILKKGFSLKQIKGKSKRVNVYFDVSAKGKVSDFLLFTGGGCTVPLNTEKDINKRVRKLKKVIEKNIKIGQVNEVNIYDKGYVVLYY